MKLHSCFSITSAIGPMLVILLFANCKKEHIPAQSELTESTSTLAIDGLDAIQQSQIKTPGLFNYDPDGTYKYNFLPGSASLLAYDDNMYASTKKLSPKTGSSLLVLQGFGFNIPANAKIENIYVKARRFKEGKGSIKENYAQLVKDREMPDRPVWWIVYGPKWADPNFFPAVEGEVNYSEAGSGTNGGSGNAIYQWTPARVNDRLFGVLFQHLSPVGSSVTVHYDLVEITVNYTLP